MPAYGIETARGQSEVQEAKDKLMHTGVETTKTEYTHMPEHRTHAGIWY